MIALPAWLTWRVAEIALLALAVVLILTSLYRAIYERGAGAVRAEYAAAAARQAAAQQQAGHQVQRQAIEQAAGIDSTFDRLAQEARHVPTRAAVRSADRDARARAHAAGGAAPVIALAGAAVTSAAQALAADAALADAAAADQCLGPDALRLWNDAAAAVAVAAGAAAAHAAVRGAAAAGGRLAAGAAAEPRGSDAPLRAVRSTASAAGALDRQPAQPSLIGLPFSDPTHIAR